MAKKMGRPPKDGEKSKDLRLEFRTDSDERSLYDEAADIAGMERSDWIRSRLRAAAEKEIATKRKNS